MKHYSIRTEDAYADWVRRFILSHGRRYPVDMGAREVEGFLTHLALQGKVAASTQNQAKGAQRLPVVLWQAEAEALQRRVSGRVGLVVRLLYAAGLRRREAARLRVKAAQADMEMTRGERVDLDTLLPLAQGALGRQPVRR